MRNNAVRADARNKTISLQTLVATIEGEHVPVQGAESDGVSI